MQLLFSIFSSLSLVCALMVIRCRNPVHSVLFLILAFVSTSALLILVHLDFFAMIYLVVYVGAIAVFFLFVVMMLNIRSAVHESVLPYFPVGALIGIIFVFQVFFILNDEALPAISTSGDTSMAAMYAGIQQVVHDISAYVNTHGVFRWEVIYASISGVYHTIAHASMMQGQDLNEVPPSSYIQWSEKAQAISNIEALAQVLYTYYFVYFLLASIILLIAMVGGITLTMHKGSPVQKQQIAEQNRRDPSKTVAKIRA